MNPLIEQHHETLVALCKEFDVQRLDLFGSAMSGSFDPDESDLDFVVIFANRSVGTYADRYLGFAEALEHLFQRKIDLVTERSIHNPYFRESVEATRQSVYEVQRKEMPVSTHYAPAKLRSPSSAGSVLWTMNRTCYFGPLSSGSWKSSVRH